MRALHVTLRSLVLTLALLVVAVPSALADMCFNAAGLPIVGQNYANPARGACRALMGNSFGHMVSGIACTNTAGTFVRVGYTIHPGQGGNVEIGQMDLPLPSMTDGQTFFRSISLGRIVDAGQGVASATVCSPAAQPVP